MKISNKTSRSIITTLLAGGALLAGGSAFAQDRVIIENGPGPVVYGQPHFVPVGVSISIGWHGDRYYDGRRYWDRDDWYRRHPDHYDHGHGGHHDNGRHNGWH